MYVKYPCTLCYERVAGKMILQTLWLKPKERRASLFCLSCTSWAICNLCTSAFTWTGSVRIHRCLLHFIYYDTEVFCPVVKPFSSKVFSSPLCLRTVVTLFSDAPSIWRIIHTPWAVSDTALCTFSSPPNKSKNTTQMSLIEKPTNNALIRKEQAYSIY